MEEMMLTAAQAEIREGLVLIEAGRERLRRLLLFLPDPDGRAPLNRDLDPYLREPLTETGVVLRCVLDDYLRPAVADLQDLAKGPVPGGGQEAKEEREPAR